MIQDSLGNYIPGDSIYQIEETYKDSTYVYDRYYRFEGYKVYQVANAEVGADELSNNDKARLVFQCDVRNNVGRLLNYEFDESLQANVPSLKVNGGDAGITHSFVVTEDEFSVSDNPSLVNNTPYYLWLWLMLTTTTYNTIRKTLLACNDSSNS